MQRTFLIFLLAGILGFVNPAGAQVWTTNNNSPLRSWTAVTSSADGSVLAALFDGGGSGGQIYTSTNVGATWTLTSAPTKSWTAVAASADGKLLLATARSGGGVYTSTNYGGTWQSNSLPGNPYWGSAAASANGSTLIAGASMSGPLYYSTNAGVNWRSNGLPSMGYWTSVAVTADGTKLAAAWSGTIYVSTNSGVAWTNYITGGGTVLSCSADGQKLFLQNNGFQLSTNWGVTFTSIPINSLTLPFAISADGKRLVQPTFGTIYASTNLGSVWNASYAPGKNWKSISLSADGSRMVAVDNTTDKIYLWQQPSLMVTNSGGNLALSWPTNGTVFNLQMNADLTTTNWVTVTNLPTVTNSLDQILVSPTNSGGFFRLIAQ